MRLLNSPDSRIIKLLGRNKVEPDRIYRLSKYAYCKSLVFSRPALYQIHNDRRDL